MRREHFEFGNIAQFLLPITADGIRTGTLVIKAPLYYELTKLLKPGKTYSAVRGQNGYTLMELPLQEVVTSFKPGSTYVVDRSSFGRGETIIVETTPYDIVNFMRDSFGLVLDVNEGSGRVRVSVKGLTGHNTNTDVRWLYPFIYTTDNPFGGYIPRKRNQLIDNEWGFDNNSTMFIREQMRRLMLDGNGLTVGTTYGIRMKPRYPVAHTDKHQVAVVVPETSPSDGGIDRLLFVPPARNGNKGLATLLRRLHF